MSQTDFAAPPGLSYSAIGCYENSIRNVTDQSVLAVCRQYDVSEERLRNGTGEVFTSSSIAPSDLAELAQKYDLDRLIRI